MLKRKPLEKELVRLLNKISGNTRSTDAYKKLWKGMNDKQFTQWFQDIVEGKDNLIVINPTGEKPGLEVQTLLSVADEVGLDLFEEIEIPNQNGIPVKTNHRALVVDSMVRRMSQSQESKINVAKNDKSVDSSTGQPTADSTGNSITSPEVELLSSYGLEATGIEQHKIKGGDLGSWRAFKASMAAKGEVSQAEIETFSTGVESSKTMNTLLLSAMLQPL